MTDTALPQNIESPFRVARLNDCNDFDPDLDIASLGDEAFKAVMVEVRRAGGRRDPDAGQIIPVILSPPGYGKTHLIGRLAFALRNDAVFIFVGAIPDPRRPLEHIRWNVVETLFLSKDGHPSQLENALADLFRDSMIAHVKQLPDPIVRQTLLNELKQDPDAVLKIVRTSNQLSSFRRLADSAAASFPYLRASVIRALVMGWSQQALLARRWLRGESLVEDEGELMGLTGESPQPMEVLQSIAAILQYRRPLVICCDQLESTLKDAEGPRQLTSQIMEVLHGVPNTFVILSCMEGDWKSVFENLSFPAFHQRTREFTLDNPSPEAGVELVQRRLRKWDGHDAARGAAWPFDLDSLDKFIREEQPTPRALIRRCADLFDRWSQGKILDPILIGGEVIPTPPELDLFRKEWAETLDQIRQNPLKSPDHVQESRFDRALRETMHLARLAGNAIPGCHVTGLKEKVLADSTANARYGMKLELASNGATVSVVAAITALNGGSALFYFIEELEKASKSAAGAVLFHPRQTFHMGPVARQKVTKMKDAGRLVIFALEEHVETFHRLECILSLIERAQSGELTLGSNTLDYEQCQSLILKARLIHDLDLFPVIGKWSGATPQAEPAPGPQPEPAPVPLPALVEGEQMDLPMPPDEPEVRRTTKRVRNKVSVAKAGRTSRR